MAIRNAKGKIVKVFPYGSKEQQRYEQFFEILLRVDLRTVERLKNNREQKEQRKDAQIPEDDNAIFKRKIKRSIKRYNMIQAAKILGVSRGTLYYWIQKEWIKPRRDHRGYPVFTSLDIENVIKWKNQI